MFVSIEMLSVVLKHGCFQRNADDQKKKKILICHFKLQAGLHRSYPTQPNCRLKTTTTTHLDSLFILIFFVHDSVADDNCQFPKDPTVHEYQPRSLTCRSRSTSKVYLIDI